MRMTLLRGGLLVLAVVVGGWLALSFRGAKLQADGERLADRAGRGPVTPAEVQRAREDLQSAARFSADNGPRLAEGLLLAAVDRRKEARTIAREVTQDEPDNIQAWFLAFTASDNRAQSEPAKRQIVRLNPWVGGQLR